MADKDKKLRVILKLPSKASKAGASAPPKVESHEFHATPVPGAGNALKPGAEIAAPNTNGRAATPPKKRKFKTLVEGDHGGVCGAPISTPPVFKAPLPPLAEKASHKRKEKPLNGVIEAPLSSPEKGQGGTTAPAKKVLEGVLDKLKKKDTYGVFSEPVDAKLVPDYYDVIKEPMDFGTMYKKISKGVYYALNLFERDIMLICNNAMRYNAPETIYYKQARSIQDAARKALDVLAGQSGAPEVGNAKLVSQKKHPHPTKKGWKNTAAVKTLLDPASSDFASGASLAAEGEPDAFRREPPSDRSGSVAGDEPGLEPDAKLQDDHGAQLKPATLKDGRRPLSTDEYHRSSYKPRTLPAHGRASALAGVGGELYHLVPTGYQSEMAYAKSLSRFSVTLGAEGWKFAAHRLQRVVAPSVPFGQGWIGEHEAFPGTIFKKFPPDVKPTINHVPSLSGVVPSTSVTSASFVSTPKISHPLAQTAMDSLLTTVTSAMLASGAGSQASYSETSPMEEQPSQPVYQLEHSRGQGIPSTPDGSTGQPLWSTAQILASQVSGVPSSGMVMQTSSDSARWNGSTPQAAPTFVYSTAVRTVPTLASMDEAQAHNLGLLQADAMARAKVQSNVHNISQAPRPTQYMPQPLYTTIPSYGSQPGPFGSVPTSSQPLPSSMAPTHALKPATSQLQMGALANYGLPPSRPVLNPAGLQQTHSSRPPPDLNMQPVDSPSTPQTPSQLKTLGTSPAGLPQPLV